MNYLNVCFCNCRLLGKLFAEEVFGNGQVAVEQPANQTECKHVTALQHRLVVHACVCQAILYHLRDRSSNHIVLDAHFFYRIVCCESSLFQIRLLETVCIDNDASRRLSKLVLSLECCSIHCHEHIALVARCKDFACTNVYLETGYACQRTLRGTDIRRIIGEGTDIIPYCSRNSRKKISGQLHTIT